MKLYERMINMQKFKNGDTVYVNSIWNKEDECIITGYVEQESSTGECMYIVNSVTNGCTFGATDACVFATKKEAHQANIRNIEDKIKKYKAEIKDINDLIRFPLKYCFNGEEYTDYEAMKAYKIRAKELTGIDLL